MADNSTSMIAAPRILLIMAPPAGCADEERPNDALVVRTLSPGVPDSRYIRRHDRDLSRADRHLRRGVGESRYRPALLRFRARSRFPRNALQPQGRGHRGHPGVLAGFADDPG